MEISSLPIATPQRDQHDGTTAVNDTRGRRLCCVIQEAPPATSVADGHERRILRSGAGRHRIDLKNGNSVGEREAGEHSYDEKDSRHGLVLRDICPRSRAVPDLGSWIA